MNNRLLLIALISVLGSYISSANADESRPLYIEITEQQSLVYQLKWRVPSSIGAFDRPHIDMPDYCSPIGAAAPAGSKIIVEQTGTYHYTCGEPLAGKQINIRYPNYTPAVSSLVKYHNVQGEQHTLLLMPGELSWTLPQTENKASVALDYTLLGAEHIWIGLDHLLFITCLLWIAGSFRRILITITGFTAAHSATLILSALQVVQLPVPPVEACIALSIVFLATEIAKGKRNNLTWRYPITVSSSFGLLHGFGFAAALSEVGMPQSELLTGLIFFNVGVEIGQVIFALAVLGLGYSLRPIFTRLKSRYTNIPSSNLAVSYVVGVLASYWLIERIVFM